MTTTFDKLESVKALKTHYETELSKTHLKTLLTDAARNDLLRADGKAKDFILDCTHTKLDATQVEGLKKLAEETKIFDKIGQMFAGEVINNTEKRPVLHTALRKPKTESLIVNGVDVVKSIHEVSERIQKFSADVRSGTFTGFSGKKLTSVVAIGIGGSFLGPEFVFEALRFDEKAKAASEGMKLRFLANVDPIDFFRATDGLNVEETLFVIVSKTFTTAETMLNARTCRKFILDEYKKLGKSADENEILGKHLCAASTNLEATAKFGIQNENVFGFWDWVGGRYSVSSAVGLLPLSLFYGFEIMQQFLDGMRDIDVNFSTEKDIKANLPVFLGLVGFYNSFVAGNASRAILPYCQALLRFPAHIQQCDMESNGKTVNKAGVRYETGVDAGPIIFGEPGTNGQHSFYQLMHQGRVIPAEFIGFTKSQTPIVMDGEKVKNHEELMSNFFAQPDALALGKSIEELKAAGTPEELQEHKFFSGDRPSLSILFNGSADPFHCGQLLALYEHRIAVEGFIYDCNSFDQWGVQLGKVLAGDTRDVFEALHKGTAAGEAAIPDGKFNNSTQSLLKYYVNNM